ncbi:hypothetical protein PF006_g17420 [Phytophthora fragariae]|uniref:Uncharacterized protein n=1 Tax=Phytophthora fragariae TaxID=53985 RepID=A0A6A3T3S0_9STRA|nr:hypothetical protein PF003_g9879 [Phytophthora fragariae]KAE9123441.1 hypothetical protein PF006_g17420 [Phytophthora fragariae]
MQLCLSDSAYPVRSVRTGRRSLNRLYQPSSTTEESHLMSLGNDHRAADRMADELPTDDLVAELLLSNWGKNGFGPGLAEAIGLPSFAASSHFRIDLSWTPVAAATAATALPART